MFSPRTRSLNSFSRSSTSTLRPLRATADASVDPPRPPPIVMTSRSMKFSSVCPHSQLGNPALMATDRAHVVYDRGNPEPNGGDYSEAGHCDAIFNSQSLPLSENQFSVGGLVSELQQLRKYRPMTSERLTYH